MLCCTGQSLGKFVKCLLLEAEAGLQDPPTVLGKEGICRGERLHISSRELCTAGALHVPGSLLFACFGRLS